MSSSVEQIKSRLSIVDVVGSYLKLEKAGGNFKAKCPFHNEKTPSFFISPGRESYHCFGCNKGGDIFSFVEEMEGVEFIDALKILAEKAGVKLDEKEKSEKSEKGRIFSLMNSAIEFMRRELVKNKDALMYLKDRGLTGDTVKKFRIGYAPAEWRALSDHLKTLGYTEKEMEASGLIIRSPSGYYDRFRGRIMFPIMNSAGMPVGFSGRIFDDKTGSKDNPPAKYINTPQTVLYDKSRVLFGLDKAKLAIRQKNECILVEGQMDLIMSHQAGVENAVAVSGTALTEEHMNTIGRLAEKVIMSFDGDMAGLKASFRAINMALGKGMQVRLLSLSEKDPADIVKKDKEEWIATVGNSKHIIDFLIDSIKENSGSKSELLKGIEKQVLPYLACIGSKMEQAEFVNKIAELVGISETAVWDDLKKAEQGVEKLSAPESVGQDAGGKKEIKKSEYLAKKIWAIIKWQETAKEPILDVKRSRAVFEEIWGSREVAFLDENLSQRINDLILEAEIAYENSDDLPAEANSLLEELKEEILRVEREKKWNAIKSAEKENDAEGLAKHLKEFQEISKNIDALKKKNNPSKL